MDNLLLVEVIRQLPALLLVGLVGAAGFRFRSQIGRYLVSRSHLKVAAAGFSLEADGELGMPA